MILSIRFLRGGGYTDSGWVDCATLTNGALPFNTNDSQSVERRVLDFKKFKLVQIKGEITLPRDVASSITSLAAGAATTVFALPSGLPVGDKGISKLMPGKLASTARWNLTVDGINAQIVWLTLDPALSADAELWFPVDFTYISQ